MTNSLFLKDLEINVRSALQEDIGSGDISASLIPTEERAVAQVICRETAVICGQPWVNEVFNQIDPSIKIDWDVIEGSQCQIDDVIFKAYGSAKNILSAERTALNFLQILSGTATIARHYAELVQHTAVKILDTRKTIPGLRLAQKYAVTQGGCYNHRLGLYDAFLLKENHISACGGIAEAIAYARRFAPEKPVEVEVETLEQLEIALKAKADTVMLDNFSLETLRQAVVINKGRALLEASGGYDNVSIVAVAETGVDYISIGALTKHCRA
ncbi:carboxylating nicotinate-nucleotide diphosphorylase, partial [bacterium AH-315-I11]|nr:carboxylating nicotinate-nucleotide diphosphorylase [bacterium AH-315-I11]